MSFETFKRVRVPRSFWLMAYQLLQPRPQQRRVASGASEHENLGVIAPLVIVEPKREFAANGPPSVANIWVARYSTQSMIVHLLSMVGRKLMIKAEHLQLVGDQGRTTAAAIDVPRLL